MLDNKTNKNIEVLTDSLFIDLYNKKISKPLNKNKNYLEELKINMSKIDLYCPLYDIYSENLYFISKENVYDRVNHHEYRFLKSNDLKRMTEYKNKMISTGDNDDEIIQKINKIEKIENFYSNFDIDILYITYIKILYETSIGKKLTFYKKKSFTPYFYHIEPYYTENEIISLSKNFGLDITQNMESLYKHIINNEITAKILIEHQTHIIKNSGVNSIQYYTTNIFKDVNKYLRDNKTFENKIIEELILKIKKIIDTSPVFDNNYILYRFLSSDIFLSNLEIGDTYIEKGFISATRDPFYRPDLKGFGNILMKINIPKNKIGVGLCIETISFIPSEQEVLLSPNTILKLIKTGNDVIYNHTENINILHKYEFDYIDKSDLILQKKDKLHIDSIDFITNLPKQSIMYLSNNNKFEEKMEYFVSNYVNENGHFKTKLGDEEIILTINKYNSKTIYKKIYGITTDIGYSINYIYNAYPLFSIELSNTDEIISMYVNYNIYYSNITIYDFFKEESFLILISSIAYYFGAMYVLLFSDHISCDVIDKKNIKLVQHGGSDVISTLYGGYYCKDIFDYILKGIKKFNKSQINTIELKPCFSYNDIDLLKNIDTIKILNENDNDEIYQIYENTYTNNKNKKDIISFILWMKDNKCYLLKKLLTKISRILKENPFNNDAYLLDGACYLYNRKIISTFPNYTGTKIVINYRNY